MAIFGKSNIIDAIRATRLVYWRIFQGGPQKVAGSFLASSDFENAQLGEKASYDDLQAALNRLTAGRYILLAYRTNSTKGGSAFESDIEIDGNGSLSVGIGSTGAEFYLEGIGKVTSENFEAAIDKKLSMKLDAMQKEKDDQALRDRVKQLELEAKEADSAINKGLMAVGTVLYSQLSKTPAFSEVIGLVTNITKAANGTAAQPATHLGNNNDQAATANPVLRTNHIEGDTAEIGGIQVNQDELFSTLDELGKDNPEVLQHLKILAKLKKDNPAMYNQAVDMAGSL